MPETPAGPLIPANPEYRTIRAENIISDTISAEIIGTAPLPTESEDIANKEYVDLHLPLTGGTLTGQLNTISPVFGTNAANKTYVDSIASGLQIKQAVRVATTGNVVSISGLLTIDGVTLLAGDRVLLKNQTDGIENGIYDAAVGPWDRSTDLADGSSARAAFTLISEGTVNQNFGYVRS